MPGPRTPGEVEDYEWTLHGLLLAIARYLTDPDPWLQQRVAQWAAEAAMLQEILRGLNDPG